MIWLETHFLWFIIYSIVGWIWEVIICSIPAKKFINRGFLNGPYCPIYGSGALLVITLLGNIDNLVLLFFAGSFLACLLEYITSWAMEKVFHAKWWDYSNYCLNINGRICLPGAVAFGTFSVLAITVIHPKIVTYTQMIPETARSIIALALFTVTLTDTVYTIARIAEFERKLKELTDKINVLRLAINDQRNVMIDKIQEKEIYLKFTKHYAEIYKRFNSQERRLIKAFPKLRSIRYDKALQKIKHHIFGNEDDENTPS
jgi:uncharacterized membrane protein